MTGIGLTSIENKALNIQDYHTAYNHNNILDGPLCAFTSTGQFVTIYEPQKVHLMFCFCKIFLEEQCIHKVFETCLTFTSCLKSAHKYKFGTFVTI